VLRNLKKRAAIGSGIFLIFIIFGLVVASFIGNVAADSGRDKICEFCKERITAGPYIEVEGKYYHPEHFFCDHCRSAIGTKPFYTVDGKHYCQKCYRELFIPKCAVCGKTIDGEYIEYNGKAYHKECYENHVAKRCSLCGSILEGKYLGDYWGNFYCLHHQGNEPQCDYCGRFISDRLTGGGFQYSDGRYICSRCRNSAVDDINRAGYLLDGVIQRLSEFGIDIETDNIHIHLIDKNELTQISDEKHRNHTGYTFYNAKSVNGEVLSKTFDIYILHGMPEVYFVGTAAHELMHVWQYTNAPFENDPALSEGSCNYASHLVLQSYPGKMAEYYIYNMEQNPDEFYGEGYRRVRKLVRHQGVDRWLKHLRLNKNFPAGY